MVFDAKPRYRLFLFDVIHWFLNVSAPLLKHRTCLMGKNIFQKIHIPHPEIERAETEVQLKFLSCVGYLVL